MSETPKVLLVVGDWPEPTNVGGRQRTNLMWNALRSFAQTHLLVLRPVWEKPSEASERVKAAGNVHTATFTPRGARGGWGLVRGLSPKLIDRLAHNLGSRRVDYAPDPGIAPVFQDLHARFGFDVIVSRYLLTIAKCGALNAAPCVVDVDDLDTQVYNSRILTARGWRRAVLQHHKRQLDEIVPKMLERCVHRWVVASEDMKTIGDQRTSILPNIPFSMPSSVGPSPEGSQEALIVASWTHQINCDGVSRFLRSSWPQVLKRVPGARLRLVGSGMPESLRDEWARVPRVDVIGLVDDLAAEYARARVCLVPLYEGGGSKIKLLEALAHGRAVVTTHHSLRGYDHVLHDGDSVRAASTDEDFAAGVADVLGDPSLADRLGARGRDIVRANFSRERFFSIVRRDVEAVLARS